MALAHAFAAGGTPSESERPLSIGGYDRISDSVFEEYDYTALGHLHRPQKTQKESEKIQYSGSLMRYSFDEVNQKKGVIVGESTKKGRYIPPSMKWYPAIRYAAWKAPSTPS